MNWKTIAAVLAIIAMIGGFVASMQPPAPMAAEPAAHEQEAADPAASGLSAAAPAADKDPRMVDHFIGKADAPVTIIEYASLTCGHCAHFQKAVLPDLKKEFVDTGKVKLIFRDFPLDGNALKASAIARCMPATSYHAFLNILFETQEKWAGAQDPMALVIQSAKLGGLPEAEARKCMDDTKLLDALAEMRTQGGKTYDIKSTPTFILNDGAEKIMGAQNIEAFREKINKLLPAATDAKPQ